MDTARKQKIENAIYNVINYATKGFLGTMSVILAGLFLLCLLQIFKDPVMSIFGCIGCGGSAVFLREAKKSI